MHIVSTRNNFWKMVLALIMRRSFCKLFLCFVLVLIGVSFHLNQILERGLSHFLREELEDFTNFYSKATRSRDVKKVLFWFVPGGDATMPLEFVGETRGFKMPLSEFDVKIRGFQLNSQHCGKCHFTFDTSQHAISDAVVFHGYDVVPSNLPWNQTRKPGQQYIWWYMETLPHYQRMDHKFMSRAVVNDYFNLTMGIKPISDIYTPFANLPWILKLIWNKNKGKDFMKELSEAKASRDGSPLISYKKNQYLEKFPSNSETLKFSIIPSEYKFEVTKILQRKTRFAVSVVSNCIYPREVATLMHVKYVDELVKLGLKIDRFGKCGNNMNPFESRWDPAFFEMLSKYKFYFAMENSYHCNGYTSKELWFNALYSGSVPVIFGPDRNVIKTLLPLKSYIHVEDFSSPQDLLEYLKFLDTNVRAYAEYLEWRSWIENFDGNGECILKTDPLMKFNKNVSTTLSYDKDFFVERFCPFKQTGLCALCKRLHAKPSTSHSVKNLRDFLLSDRPECFNRTLAKKMFSKSWKGIDKVFEIERRNGFE